jgi:hypothetical protein
MHATTAACVMLWYCICACLVRQFSIAIHRVLTCFVFMLNVRCQHFVSSSMRSRTSQQQVTTDTDGSSNTKTITFTEDAQSSIVLNDCKLGDDASAGNQLLVVSSESSSRSIGNMQITNHMGACDESTVTQFRIALNRSVWQSLPPCILLMSCLCDSLLLI